MPSLQETIERLAALRAASARSTSATRADHLIELEHFGSNPGALSARVYCPSASRRAPALVVALHGCLQTAAVYDRGAGWSQLADRHGFVVLFPEQQQANNPNRCFNWFLPNDARRDQGEALSIFQMIEMAISKYGVDRNQVFITGLSAGGAMACAMLATYPEVFAGGAILSGLPFGVAASMPEAFGQMRRHSHSGNFDLERLVRDAGNHRGKWPKVSVWHGSADTVVAPSNGAAVVRQWRSLHGCPSSPTRTEQSGAQEKRIWTDRFGVDVVEENVIAGMDHGVAIDGSAGQAGPYFFNVGISSSLQIADFWGLTVIADSAAKNAPTADRGVAKYVFEGEIVEEEDEAEAFAFSRDRFKSRSFNVNDVIENALRAAGLMK